MTPKEDVFGKIPVRGHALICVAVRTTRLACLSFMQVVRSRLPDAYAQIFAEALVPVFVRQGPQQDAQRVQTHGLRRSVQARRGRGGPSRVGDS